MSTNSTIGWTDDTRNFAAGCSEPKLLDGTMSQECAHCYARLLSVRLAAMMSAGTPSAGKARIAALYGGVSERRGGGAAWTGTFRHDPILLAEAFAGMRAGKITFAGSMTDLFHAEHAPELLTLIAGEIRKLAALPAARQPRGIVLLTKRPERLLTWQRREFPDGLPAFVWPGVTGGYQPSADERLPTLLRVRADGPLVLSAEPLLGALDARGYVEATWIERAAGRLNRGMFPLTADGQTSRLGWLITGCESGPKRRPTDPDWIRSLRDQCADHGVPFFLKQMIVGGEVIAEPEIDGRQHVAFPA